MALPAGPPLNRHTTTYPLRYCGRSFSADQMELIRELIASEPARNRAWLSRRVCEMLGWRRADGRLKDMSCRVAMLRMARDGHVTLPPPQKGNGNGRNRPRITRASDPRDPVSLPAGALGQIVLRPVSDPQDGSLWNEIIQRYHYLGYKPLPGAQIRYLVWAGASLVAALGFGAAAWKVAPRDRFIGWTVRQRQARLPLVVNNARFLILPWVDSRNLASRILARAARQLPGDWRARYGYAPVLLETFVQSDRFNGTSYRAANWLHVGRTQGRGKLDRHMLYPVPVKDVCLYPLHRHFRRELCAAPQ
jgi:hypothetical protein